MIEYILAFLALYTTVFYFLLYLSKSEEMEDPKPKDFPSITIIIQAYNEEKTIGKTISSALSLEYPKNKLKILVVNDGSTDKTAHVARKYKVQLLDKKNTGKANSLNRAIKKTKTDLIAVLDADSYVDKKALLRTVGYFKHKEVGSVTSAMKVWKPKSILERMQRSEYLINAFIKKLQSFIDGISVTPGPLSIYRRSVFSRIGFFDEHTLTEDQEFALRMQSSDIRIENSINAYVYTSVPKTPADLFKQRRRWYLGYLQNIWKHKELFSPRYGDFGLFVLPTAFVLLIFTVISLIWAYFPKTFDLSFSFQMMPSSLLYLEFTPTRIAFLAVFLINAIAVIYTLRNTKESGFLGSFLSLFVISYIMLMLWIVVLAEHISNTVRGVKPLWRGN